MKYYSMQHNDLECGIDLHAELMSIYIPDINGRVKFHKDLKTSSEAFSKVIQSQQGAVVTAECLLSWYGDADVCRDKWYRG